MSCADQLAQDALRLAEFPADVVRAATSALADAVNPRLTSDTGGDNRLSGAGRARLRVVEQVTDGYAFADGSASAGPRRAFGLWRIVDDGSRPHGGHPGTRAKRTWTDPASSVQPLLEQLVDGMFRVVIT